MLSLTVHRVNVNVYMALLADVTAVAELQRKLCFDRRKFFAIFDNVRDYAFFTITLEGKIEEWNRSLERLGGWLPEDVQGRDMSIFLPPDDSVRPRLDAALAEARRTGSVEGRELAAETRRIAVLGELGHHCAAGRGRRGAGLCGGDARLD